MTRWPAFTRLAAIGAPMLPSPMKPITAISQHLAVRSDHTRSAVWPQAAPSVASGPRQVSGGTSMPGEYPLPSSDPASLGLAVKPLDHLDRLIKQHIEEGRYPGAQIALARHGQLALFRTYGNAKIEPN